MKITDVFVDGFGVWRDFALRRLASGATVVLGPNEAGKTTLMEFIRGVLFGFREAAQAGYLPPLRGGRGGGSLRVRAGGRVWDVRREAPAGDDDQGRCTVVAADGSTQAGPPLAELLKPVDAAVYRNVFAVGLRQLHELAALNATAAAEHLYSLTAGVDRVNLAQVLRRLDEATDGALAPEGPLRRLAARRAALAQQLEEATRDARRWPEVLAQRDQKRRAAEELQQHVRRLEQEAKTVEAAIQARDAWAAQRRTAAELERLGPLPDLPPDALVQLDELRRTMARAARRLKQIVGRRAALRRRAAEQPLDRALWSQRARIQALVEHEPWLDGLERRVAALRREVRELGQRAAQGGRPAAPEALKPLREPAAAVRRAAERLRAARAAWESRRRTANELALRLRQAAGGRRPEELAGAVERAGRRLRLLRRRLELDERLEQMALRRRELEHDTAAPLEGEPPPLRLLAGLGVLFVLGVALIFSGLLGRSLLGLPAGLGWPLALLGLAGVGVSAAAKLVWERSAARRLATRRQQLDVLAGEIERAEAEQSQLAQELPASPDPPAAQVQQAERELAELDRLLPLETERREALRLAAAARRELAEAIQTARQARQQWRAALRRQGLPESLTPRQLREQARQGRQAAHWRQQWEQRRRELQEREDELRALAQRVEQLERRAGTQSPPRSDASLVDRLRALASQLEQQRRRARRLAAARRADRRLRDAQRRCRRVLADRQRRLSKLLAAAGVADQQQLRQAAARRAQAAALEQRQRELAQQLQHALRHAPSPDSALQHLEAAGDGPEGARKLEQRWEHLAQQLEQAQAKLAETHQQLGAFEQQAAAMARDRRLPERRLALAQATAQLEEAARQWRVAAVTRAALLAVREAYQRRRQPETLRRASSYFRELTAGRHQRVWTPLDQPVLLVDDARGQSLPVAALSQGAREALFLCLRLALAEHYASRGRPLPLVLDDVLVNLDPERARGAAAAIRRFAEQGGQALLFTCHPHVAELLGQTGAAVRRLPAAREEGRNHDDPKTHEEKREAGGGNHEDTKKRRREEGERANHEDTKMHEEEEEREPRGGNHEDTKKEERNAGRGNDQDMKKDEGEQGGHVSHGAEAAGPLELIAGRNPPERSVEAAAGALPETSPGQHADPAPRHEAPPTGFAWDSPERWWQNRQAS